MSELVRRVIDGREELVFSDAAPSLYAQLQATAERTPDAVAVVDQWGHRCSYGLLLKLVDGLAAHLWERYRVRPGDRVDLLMHADLEYIVSLYALNRIGAVCVAVPTKYRCPEAVAVMFSSDPVLVIAGEEFEGWAPRFPVEPTRVLWSRSPDRGYGFRAEVRDSPRVSVPVQENPAAPAVMMFTSGTTSESKGVVLRNYNLVHAAMAYADAMGTGSEDRTLVCLPIYYVTGLVALVAQFVLVGARLYLQRRFDPEEALALVRCEGITYLHCSPTAFALLLERRADHPELPSLRHLLSGSSRDSVAVMRAYHDWLPQATYQVVYGLTETASPALLFPGDTPTSDAPGATGVPFAGVEARVVRPDGRPAHCGERGELWLRGANVTRGYFRRDDPAIHPDGWFQTGDVAFEDEDGLFWVVDRLKDMINRGGEKVWCSSVEECLEQVPGVQQSCVSRIPDDVYGEVPVAAVVLAPDSPLTVPSLLDELSGRIAHYEVPEHLILVDHIPLTRADKPDRAAVTDTVLADLERKKAFA